MPSAKLNSKGQITIPRAIREHLGVDAGDRISFRIRDDGTVEVAPETVDMMSLFGVIKPDAKGVSVEVAPETVDMMSLFGVIKPDAKGVSVEDMNSAIRRRAGGR